MRRITLNLLAAAVIALGLGSLSHANTTSKTPFSPASQCCDSQNPPDCCTCPHGACWAGDSGCGCVV